MSRHIQLAAHDYMTDGATARRLRSYLADIRSHVEDADTVSAIEERMVELLETYDVRPGMTIHPRQFAMLKEHMGDAESFAAASESIEPSGRHLYRNVQGGHIAGVARGISDYCGIDAVWIRLIFVTLFLLCGWGAVLYIALWIALPALGASDPVRTARPRPLLKLAGVCGIGISLGALLLLAVGFGELVHQLRLDAVQSGLTLWGFAAAASTAAILGSLLAALLALYVLQGRTIAWSRAPLVKPLSVILMGGMVAGIAFGMAL